MKYGKIVAAAAAVVAFLAMSVGAAFATPAYATGSVNVRTGPGVGYHRVGTLYPGEYVDVQQCQSGWCFVARNGPNGWVSAKYLGQGGYRNIVRPRPDVSVQFHTPGFGFSFGTPQPRPWPRPYYREPWPRYYPWPRY